MNNSISHQFRVALNHLLRQEGRGAQVRLSTAQNIDRGYLNAVIKGRKPGAEEIRARIATHFEMTYEEMLALGRRVLDGQTDDTESLAEQIGPSVHESVGGKETRGDNDRPEKEDGYGSLLTEKLLKIREILESETKYSISLTAMIDAYHQEIVMGREKQMLDVRLKMMEDRLGQVEKLLATEKSVVSRLKPSKRNRTGDRG